MNGSVVGPRAVPSAQPDWVFVGLGGNLGGIDAVQTRLTAAEEALRDLPYVGALVRSSSYRTAPLGPVRDQPVFVNAVVGFELRASVDPVRLLGDLLALESALGRDRRGETPQGARAVDLDLLLFGQRALDLVGPPRVTVPHPRMAGRAFVLRPLVELVGAALLLPGTTRSLGQCLAEVGRQDVQRLSDPVLFAS